jgi:hypothetical protein
MIRKWFSFILTGVLIIGLPGTQEMVVAQRKSAKSGTDQNAFRAEFRFEFSLHKENFDSASRVWPVISNSDNLALVQEGEYILMRKNTETPFAVLGEFGRDLSELMISASLSISSRNVEQGSAGILFMAQQDGSGGFIAELNTEHQFRLRQITRQGYRFMTGQEKESGWIRLKQLPVASFHHFDIRAAGGHYEIRIDDIPVIAFDDPGYTQGAIGLFIGPASVCRVDYMDLYSMRAELKSTTTDAEIQQGNQPDLVVLSETIVDLRTEIGTLKQQNEDLKQRIETLKGSDQEVKVRTTGLEKRIRDLEKGLEQEKKTSDSLRVSNAELVRYKQVIEESGGGDLVNTLSKSLKSEKLRSDELELRNQVLQDSLRILKQEVKQQFNWTPVQEPAQGKGGYTLPKDK